MGTNIDRERASDERVLSTKSHKLFIIWKSHVPWQIKNVISPLPRYLLPPSLTWWWFFGKEPQATKLHVVLITWLREVTWRHMTKKKCSISTSTRPMATRCDTVITVMTYENSLTPTIVTWKKNHVTNKTRYIYFYKAHGYQTQQGHSLWYWITTHKFIWFFDHVIICSLVINEKRYIFNSTSPMYTNLDRVRDYDMGSPIKKLHRP